MQSAMLFQRQHKVYAHSKSNNKSQVQIILRRDACHTAALPARMSQNFSISNVVAAAAAAAAAPLLAGLLLMSCAEPAAASAAASIAVLEGPARIVDGDTLYIGSEKVRLYAVDAPEKMQACSNSRGQPYMCGQVSLQALKEHVGNNPVRCNVKTKDQYGRNVAACSILFGRLSEDMGSWLVSNGYAVAYKQYGKDYVLVEEKAHAQHKGIWQGEFTEPALWRKQQKAANLTNMLNSSNAPAVIAAKPSSAAAPAVAAAAGVPSYAAVAAMGQNIATSPTTVSTQATSLQCNGPLVKGNINSKGDKIYHTVKSGSYARVEIDEKAGEKYFCTEQEALAAGWRAALK